MSETDAGVDAGANDGAVRTAGAMLPIEPAPRDAADTCHYWQYCVNCGTKLESRKCKLFCPKCGFYHSCSEP